ncbi:MAG: hypothetical protein COB41_00180 [Proteobacteria bacterium]|nr:MAG: hypothetical protein COB41_00180 [Pseudomonadota bacterium]
MIITLMFMFIFCGLAFLVSFDKPSMLAILVLLGTINIGILYKDKLSKGPLVKYGETVYIHDDYYGKICCQSFEVYKYRYTFICDIKGYRKKLVYMKPFLKTEKLKECII